MGLDRRRSVRLFKLGNQPAVGQWAVRPLEQKWRQVGDERLRPETPSHLSALLVIECIAFSRDKELSLLPVEITLFCSHTSLHFLPVKILLGKTANLEDLRTMPEIRKMRQNRNLSLKYCPIVRKSDHSDAHVWFFAVGESDVSGTPRGYLLVWFKGAGHPKDVLPCGSSLPYFLVFPQVHRHLQRNFSCRGGVLLPWIRLRVCL